MSIKKILLLPVLLSVFYFISCSDDPSSIGSGLLGADEIIIEQTDSYTDSISQSSTSTLTLVPLGSSNRLLAGRHANVEASFLIRFAFAFPDSVKQDILADSLIVSSAKISLTRVYRFGGSSSGVLDLNIEKVISPWTSSGFTADSLPALQTTAVTVDSLNITDSITSFKIDNSLAFEWLKNTADPSSGTNWGLYVKPGTTADEIFGYQALISGAENVPGIQLIIQKPGVYTDTLNFIPNADISVLKNTAAFPSGEFITVQAGMRIMTFLTYDISSLPPFAVINKAELFLRPDTLQSITATDLNNKVVAYVPADTTNLDSIGSATVDFAKNDTIYSGNITTLVQDWLTKKNNRGLVITTSNELNGLERFVFWGSNAVNPALRPRLVITYTNKL